MTKRISETKSVKDFHAAASEYCNLLDRFETIPKVEFLHQVFILLHRMILLATSLPEIQRLSDYEVPHVSNEEWQKLYSSLKNYIGSHDTYFQVADPYDEDDRNPIQMSIAGDISEIYQELQPSLVAFQSCNLKDKLAIIWEWKFLLKAHWGDHATRAARALYSLLYYNDSLEES